MEPKQRPLIVIDSCLYIHFLTNQNPSLAQKTQALLQNDGFEHDIILPAIVQAEVVGVARIETPKKRDTVTQRTKAARKAADFFEDACFQFVEADQRLTERAVENVIEYDIHGADAMILATAQVYGAAYLYTADKPLQKANGLISDLKICEPPEPTTLVFPSGN